MRGVGCSGDALKKQHLFITGGGFGLRHSQHNAGTSGSLQSSRACMGCLWHDAGQGGDLVLDVHGALGVQRDVLAVLVGGVQHHGGGTNLLGECIHGALVLDSDLEARSSGREGVVTVDTAREQSTTTAWALTAYQPRKCGSHSCRKCKIESKHAVRIGDAVRQQKHI